MADDLPPFSLPSRFRNPNQNKSAPMADDNVPPNPSTPPPSTSYHEVLNSSVKNLDMPNLEDSNFSGSPDPESCTLILTEGGSSKYFDRGSSLIGQNNYSVLPLKGKLLNVREATSEQLLKNVEIQNIMKILGLQAGKNYDSVNGLRYGHLLIVADKDDDGLHMIGLLINFLHYFWPSLLRVKAFMRLFLTPFVLAVNENTNEVLTFYTFPEYQAWKKEIPKKARGGWKKKYYEGPETIESDKHIKDFVWYDFYDGIFIEMAFSGKTEAINQWLKRPQPGTHYTTSTEKEIRYSDFINRDFKPYVAADLRRSIPSMVDGLKPDQREILFHAFKKPIFDIIEVPYFSAYVLNRSPNLHGVASLVGTIIGMAQKYVGSNNINLLQPNGQFGTRLMGGKDHVPGGRCLIAKLSSITRHLFHPDDELIIDHLNDDIKHARIPIIPMVLVNGSEGRGVACNSFIPNYNPRVIIANLKSLINGKEVASMCPWYRGFTGDIQKEKEFFYTTKGTIKKNKNVLTISELPVGMWTQDYEEFLNNKVGKDIKAYTDRSDNINNVHFEVTMSDSAIQEGGFSEKLKLTTILSTANMHVLNEVGELKKCDTPEKILEDFYHFRLELYEKRRKALIRKLGIAFRVLENKVKFINKVLKGEIDFFPLKGKDKWCDELKGLEVQSLPSIENEVDHELKGVDCQSLPSIENEVDHAKETKEDVTGYDYLLITQYGEIEELKQEIADKRAKCEKLQNTRPETLWIRDLDALDFQLEKRNYTSAENRASAKRPQNAAAEPQREKRSRTEDDDNDADFEDEE